MTAPRRSPPLPREPVETLVDGFTHGGEGVARIEGKAVFVPGTLPGERVVVRVAEDRRRWARAELLEVLEPSPDRVLPPCPYVPECGGCDLQHAAPAAQRRLKTRVVREQLARLGGLRDAPVAECRPVGPDTGYRSHARLHAAPDGRLGFHRAGSTTVVPIERCLVLSPAAQAVRDAVGDATGAAEVTVRAHVGRAGAAGTAAAVLTPGPGPIELPAETVAVDAGSAPAGAGATTLDILLAQPDGSTVALRGDGILVEEVAGFALRFDASSFFQVSRAGAEALVAEVLRACGEVEGALVWDLYAGVGLFSLPLASAGAEVVAVEGHGPAAGHLGDNAAAAGLEVTAVGEPVEAVVARAAGGRDPDLEAPDVVVLDPPRSGAGARIAGDLAALAPASIVYVACDVAALARDARTLVDAGYRLAEAVPLDLFPMTHHVEVVATFVR